MHLCDDENLGLDGELLERGLPHAVLVSRSSVHEPYRKSPTDVSTTLTAGTGQDKWVSTACTNRLLYKSLCVNTTWVLIFVGFKFLWIL